MITAKEAYKITQSNLSPIEDTLELIYQSIDYDAKRGRFDCIVPIPVSYTDKIQNELIKNGFEVARRDTSTSMRNLQIYWTNAKE
jgi:hypothetical protein